MMLRVDHRHCPSDAHGLTDDPPPAASAADAICAKSIAALKRQQRTARVAAKSTVKRLCRVAQRVERILKHEDIYAAAAIAKRRVSGTAGRCAIAFVKVHPGRCHALRLDIAPYAKVVRGAPQAAAFAAAERLTTVEGRTCVVLGLLTVAAFPDALERISEGNRGIE